MLNSTGKTGFAAGLLNFLHRVFNMWKKSDPSTECIALFCGKLFGPAKRQVPAGAEGAAAKDNSAKPGRGAGKLRKNPVGPTKKRQFAGKPGQLMLYFTLDCHRIKSSGWLPAQAVRRALGNMRCIVPIETEGEQTVGQNQKNTQEPDMNQLKKVRREKLAELQANGQNPFEITKYDVTHHSQEVKDNFDELEGKHVVLAGRMMSKRVMGKASFCNVQDLQGNIQSYVARDSIGEEEYKAFKKMDIGDIVGLEGEVFKTKTGEISIHASAVKLLSKSLQILPEKFHGLTDTDMRYRQRYVDLIMNQDSKEVFIKRSQILKEIRNFLAGRDFMEVETPMLVSNAGGAAARPFETHYNALNEDVKLRISLELYLKRLIVGGLERVYEIGRVFRNEGVDTRHNPEFTLMELYQAYTDYEGMMELTESMFRYLAEKVCGSAMISYNGTVIDMAKPFERISMIDAVKKYAGVDFAEVKTDEEAKA